LQIIFAMTENPNSPKDEQNLKALIVKGAIGAVSIASATAIPLLVQKFLGPAPTANPVPSMPAQVAPAQVAPPQVTPSQVQPGLDDRSNQMSQDNEDEHHGKGKKKGKKKD
jgi:hypothetical protein